MASTVLLFSSLLCLNVPVKFACWPYLAQLGLCCFQDRIGCLGQNTQGLSHLFEEGIDLELDVVAWVLLQCAEFGLGIVEILYRNPHH